MLCFHFAKNSGATDNGYINIPEGNEDKLQEAVASVGPIAVAIDASHETFQHYKSGIYEENDCRPDVSDHGVLVVGYGSDGNDNEYYIVKNSWGKSWGESGYFKMPRNKNNHCGISTHAVWPTV